MKQIWKYQLNPGKQTISMPMGAEVLSVGNQDGNITVWALVDSNRPLQGKLFNVYATGWDVPEDEYAPADKFLGTVLVADGALVWHVFGAV